MRRIASGFSAWSILLLSAGVFALATAQLQNHRRNFADTEPEVLLPRFVQVLLSGGDRYLAANIGVVRTLLNPTEIDTPEHYDVQAIIQADSAWLNPRHEDNYYLAAGYLSWSGHIREAEEILRRAAEGRPFDFLPPFFLGFNYFYFDHDPLSGARWLHLAAQRADSETNRVSLSRIAARWAERGPDTKGALAAVQMMADQSRDPALKRFLLTRVERLQGLVDLQEAVTEYEERYHVPAKSFEDLLHSGVLKKMPIDPFGLGYRLDAQGVPQLTQPPPHQAPQPSGSSAP